jgi:hypothetical protein
MTPGADHSRPSVGGLSSEQAAHEKLIHATAESLGKATAKGEQHRLQAELYRQIAERDPNLVERWDAQRLEVAMERTW